MSTRIFKILTTVSFKPDVIYCSKLKEPMPWAVNKYTAGLRALFFSPSETTLV